MAIIDESSSSPHLKPSLAAGVNSLSAHQKVTFQQYNKYVMPTDGSVFWVKSQNAPIDFAGSLHFITDKKQDEDQTIGVNKVLFTSLQEITPFNSLSPSTIFIAQITDPSGALMQASFSERGSFYDESAIWHYRGDAVYPAMASQVINTIADLPLGPIVSNSLPLWLSMTQFGPIYSSYLVPDNVKPPYIVVHIDQSRTEAMTASPITKKTSNIFPPDANSYSMNQLTQDEVVLTLYGFTNEQAWRYLYYLMDYSLNTDSFGFLNSPTVKDEKRTQVELGIIAMKKTIFIKVSYYQLATNVIMRNLILQAGISILT